MFVSLVIDSFFDTGTTWNLQMSSLVGANEGHETNWESRGDNTEADDDDGL